MAAAHGRQVALHDVRHVGEIPRLFPVPGNDQPALVPPAFAQGGKDVGAGAGLALPRAVHVAVAQADHALPVHLRVRGTNALARLFSSAVRSHKGIDDITAGKHHPGHLGLPGGFANVERAHHVGLVAEHGILDTPRGAGNGRQMKHAVLTVKQIGNVLKITDIAPE